MQEPDIPESPWTGPDGVAYKFNPGMLGRIVKSHGGKKTGVEPLGVLTHAIAFNGSGAYLDTQELQQGAGTAPLIATIASRALWTFCRTFLKCPAAWAMRAHPALARVVDSSRARMHTNAVGAKKAKAEFMPASPWVGPDGKE
jgi:hypothetical protein